MGAFKLTNPRPLDKNSLRGVFDIQMPSGLIVRGAMLFEKNGRRWVGFPSKEWVKQDGTKSYFPLIEFADRSIADKFQAAVLPFGRGGAPVNSLPSTAFGEERLAKAEREREALRSRFSDEFRDGARCGLMREYPGDRERGGYPRGFDQWPFERRNSWYAGFNLGYHQRKTR